MSKKAKKADRGHDRGQACNDLDTFIEDRGLEAKVAKILDKKKNQLKK